MGLGLRRRRRQGSGRQQLITLTAVPKSTFLPNENFESHVN